MQHQEKINILQSQANKINATIKDLDNKIKDVTEEVNKLKKKKYDFQQANKHMDWQKRVVGKLEIAMPNAKKEELLKVLNKRLSKLNNQKTEWKKAVKSMQRAINDLKNQNVQEIRKLSSLLKEEQTYVKKLDSYKKIQKKNFRITGAGHLAFSGIGAILENESLVQDAKELQSIYPELDLSISSKEYWSKVVVDTGIDSAVSLGWFVSEVGIGRAISVQLGKFIGRIGGVVTLFFTDVPTGSFEVHDRMPNPKNKESFLSWLKVVGEKQEFYLNSVTDEDRTGERLTIPRGVVQLWQLLDLASGNPDPKFSWVHDWSFPNGEPVWKNNLYSANKFVAKVENNKKQLTFITRTLNVNTSHFGNADRGFVGARVTLEVLERNQNRTTIQENPYLAEGSTIIKAPADIVLNWGARPADLDSHLTGPLNANGSTFHTYFENRGSLNSSPNVLLYRDDTSHHTGGANHPEQTRINVTQPGKYNFYVHDFSNKDRANSTALSESRAVVTLHSAGNRDLPEGDNLGRQVARFEVPTNRVGTVWHAFELDTRRNTVREIKDNNFYNAREPQNVPKK